MHDIGVATQQVTQAIGMLDDVGKQQRILSVEAQHTRFHKGIKVPRPAVSLPRRE